MTRDSQAASGSIKAKWSKFDQTLTAARTGFADLTPDVVENLVDQAATDTRRSVREAPDLQHDDG